MTDDNDGPSGSRPSNEDILVALKGAEATAKHTREALTQNGRQTEQTRDRATQSEAIRPGKPGRPL